MKSFVFQLKSQINQRDFKITFALLCLMSIGAVLLNCIKAYGINYMRVRSAADNFLLCAPSSRAIMMIFSLLFPLIAATLGSGYRKNNEKKGDGLFSLLRMNRRQYIVGNAVAVVLITTVSILFILILNQLLCCIAFPIEGFDNRFGISVYAKAMTYDKNLLFDYWQINNPYVYNLLYSVIISVLAGGIALLTYGLELYDIFEKLKPIHISIIIFFFFIFIMIISHNLNIPLLSYLSYVEVNHNISFSSYLIFVSAIYVIGIALSLKGCNRYEYI